jgi:hypothetical protein
MSMIDNDIYSADRLAKPVVLDKGKQDKFFWAIISLGSHPVCYVGVPPGHKYYGKGYDEIPIQCHGGLTFAGKDFWFNPVSINLWWIGWDYAHYGDYYQHTKEMESHLKSGGLLPREKESHKWTMEELRAEVRIVLDQVARSSRKKR